MTPTVPTPLAIACTLSGAEMPARLREIAALGEAALLDTKVEIGQATLRFAAHDGIRERLDAIVAAEASCCSFLTFDVCDYGNQLIMRVSTPEDAQAILEEFADAFMPAAEVAA